MMFLVDTNIFLEVLLTQDRKDDCKRFLSEQIGSLHITDFALHSIGVILFRHDREDLFQRFVADVMPNVKRLSLPIEMYKDVIDAGKTMNLDFDDAYQYSAAKHYGLKIVTMDSDFRKIEDWEILFL